MTAQPSLFPEPARPLPSEVRDGQFRYVLRYPTGVEGTRRLVAMLHNPSVASAVVDESGRFNTDPTAATAIRLGRREGCAWVDIVNPFAAVATFKAELLSMEDPEGPANTRHVLETLAGVDVAIRLAGWGIVHKKLAPRIVAWRERLAGLDLVCVGINADRSPKHILYMRADAPLLPWPEKGTQ